MVRHPDDISDKDGVNNMRIVTRPDFDGISCAVIFFEAEDVTAPVKWVHPNDMQRGWVEVREGEVDAGLLSLMDVTDLEDQFEPLDFGIAVRKEARSVFLLSAREPRHLGGRRVAVTEETSTSVCLMRLILLVVVFG